MYIAVHHYTILCARGASRVPSTHTSDFAPSANGYWDIRAEPLAHRKCVRTPLSKETVYRL